MGGFDPTVTREDIRRMATDVRNFGISRVDGMVVADLTMKDTLTYGSGTKGAQITASARGRW